MAKSASLSSYTVVGLTVLATRTRTVVLRSSGTVQLWLPSLAVEAVMVTGAVANPSVE